VFPPLNFAAGVRSRGALSRAIRPRINSRIGVPMSDLGFHAGEETSGQMFATATTLIQAARPYLATLLIVTILLSIWISLRAA
jgi:hypothetical protein